MAVLQKDALQLPMMPKANEIKGGNCDALQLEGCPTLCQSCCALIKSSMMHRLILNTSATSYRFGNTDFLCNTNILAIGGIYYIYQYLCARA